jgi:hypothetical protein
MVTPRVVDGVAAVVSSAGTATDDDDNVATG